MTFAVIGHRVRPAHRNQHCAVAVVARRHARVDTPALLVAAQYVHVAAGTEQAQVANTRH